MLKAKNAARCAVVSFGDNGWNLIAALYFAAKEFGQEAEIKKLADEYYPYVCTCKKEVDKFAKTIGATDKSAEVFAACSEKAQEEASKM